MFSHPNCTGQSTTTRSDVLHRFLTAPASPAQDNLCQYLRSLSAAPLPSVFRHFIRIAVISIAYQSFQCHLSKLPRSNRHWRTLFFPVHSAYLLRILTVSVTYGACQLTQLTFFEHRLFLLLSAHVN